MYSQNVRSKSRGNGTGRTRCASGKRAEKERVRLLQLLVCLVLFLLVFVGKGVFPQHLQQVSGQLLERMEQSTDFREAFAELGESLSKEESILGELGSFCVRVFGPSDESAVPVLMMVEEEPNQEREFLNHAPDREELMAHILRMEEVPHEWIVQTEEQVESKESVQPAEVPAVGVITLQADYDGAELPEGYTMDRLSLGTLEVVTPVVGTLWSEYGYRDHPIDGEYKFHNGVDIGADQGADIVAFASGTVEYIGESDAYGKYFQIDHGQGIKSFYAHCSELCVDQGQTVAIGECVARVGATGNATGPHLHFELKCGGVHIDPAYYIESKLP